MSKVYANTIQKTIRFPINLYEKIESMAKENNTNSSYIIKYILEEYFHTESSNSYEVNANHIGDILNILKDIKYDTERIKEATGAN